MEDLFPQGTHELYKHLGADLQDDPQQQAIGKDVREQQPENDIDHGIDQNIDQNFKDNAGNVIQPQAPLSSKSKAAGILKQAAPYAIVFAVGFIVWFAFFTSFSFKAFFSSHLSKPKQTVRTEAQHSKISPEQLKAYYTWIGSYYYDVSDKKIFDPEYDISGNGLTNYQKFLLGLNPKKKDTIGLSMTDTQVLIKGIDPLSGKPMTDEQKKAINSIIDLEALANKLSLAAAYQQPKVFGAATSGNEIIPASLDTNVNAEMQIPSLQLSVPLIWTKDVKNFDNDLINGLVHYPGTPLPGEIGTAYISGHSSNYAWAKGKYNQIFEHLDKLQKYDSFTIKATDKFGGKILFHYVVASSGVFKPDDQQQFANIGKSSVALSTCWPVGSTSDRFVVFGYLTQTERVNGQAAAIEKTSAANFEKNSLANFFIKTAFAQDIGTAAFVDLKLSQKVSNDTKNIDNAASVPADKEDFLTYTLTVQNQGNSDATNYVILNDLASVLAYSTIADLGGGSMRDTTIYWPALTIQPNGVVKKSFRVRVNYFLPPQDNNLAILNTFGNTVTRVSLTNKPEPTFSSQTYSSDGGAAKNTAAAKKRKKSPKTGASAAGSAFIFAGAVTAGFAYLRRKGKFQRFAGLFS